MKGSIKVGWATEDDGCEFEYLSDKNPRVLKIPLVCIMVIKLSKGGEWKEGIMAGQF